MPRGAIRRLISNRGFGFIKRDDGGKDLFFYRSALRGADYWIDFDSLSEGLPVQFEVGKGHDNRPQAVKVRLTLVSSRSNTSRSTETRLMTKLF